MDLIGTGLAVLRPTPEGMVLQEVAPGVTVAQVQATTGPRLIVAGEVATLAA